VLLDVTTIFTQVHGDEVGPGSFGLLGSKDGIWIGSAASLAEGRHVIHIHAQRE
jgi:hypothetical protein